jgi:uncharacterized circularly permuted ATP-grasp superfamily protein
MANALGSAFLESPAVQGFLPGISQALLGSRWRCRRCPPGGAARPPPGRRARQPGWAGAGAAQHLPGAGAPRAVSRTAAIGRPVDDDPDAWTVQATCAFARATRSGATARWLPRPAVVRVYAIADGDGRWHVLPGGMTRVARARTASVSMQRGGTSLDTWVLTDGPVDTFSMLPQRLSVDDIGRAAGRSPAAPARTCSGWAATPSAPNSRCGWRAPR